MERRRSRRPPPWSAGVLAGHRPQAAIVRGPPGPRSIGTYGGAVGTRLPNSLRDRECGAGRRGRRRSMHRRGGVNVNRKYPLCGERCGERERRIEAGGASVEPASRPAVDTSRRAVLERRCPHRPPPTWSAGVLAGHRRRRAWCVGLPAHGPSARSARACGAAQAGEDAGAPVGPALHAAVRADEGAGPPCGGAGVSMSTENVRFVGSGVESGSAGLRPAGPASSPRPGRRSIRQGAQFWSAGVLTGHRPPGAPASSPATAGGGHGAWVFRPTVRRLGRQGPAVRRRPARTPALHGAGAPCGSAGRRGRRRSMQRRGGVNVN